MAKISALPPIADPTGEEAVVVLADGLVQLVALSAMFAAVTAPLQPIVTSSNGKNRFNPEASEPGKEINASSGELGDHPASEVSGLIYVRDCDTFTIHGLPPNTAGGNNYDRQYAFYGADGRTVVARSFVAFDATGFPLRRPEDAYFWRIDLSRRNGVDGDYGAVQVENGALATDFEPFNADNIVSIGGKVIRMPAVPKASFVGAKNLFDSAAVVPGAEVHGTGNLIERNDSSYVLIYVGHLRGKPITVSGLQASTFSRYYNFHNSAVIAAASKLTGGEFTAAVDGGTVMVPNAGLWLALSPWQRNSDAPDYSLVQVEAGAAATPYEAFEAHVGMFDGVPVAGMGGDNSPAAYSGGPGFGFGDSISAVTDVDEGSFLYPTGFTPNWPDYAIPLIKPSAYYSFARSGAHFATFDALLPNQRFENQVTAAIAYAAANGIVPRWLVVSFGTNDKSSSLTLPAGYGGLGAFETAMAKDLTFDGAGVPSTELESSISLEAARLNFARLRWQFPETVMFCALPLQRADLAPQDMVDWVDAIAQMARAYGFEVIDCFGRSGILKEFEKIGAPGRDLIDGLHPNASGQAKQGRLIAAQIMARLAA